MGEHLFDDEEYATFEFASNALALDGLLAKPDPRDRAPYPAYHGDFPPNVLLEMHNFCSSYVYRLKKDTPAKRWWHAKGNPNDKEGWHGRARKHYAAIARAMRIDPKDDGAQYALLPFHVMRDEDDRAFIGVAWPCPRNFIPMDPNHLCIRYVLAWYPTTGEFRVMGDDNPQLFGNLDCPRAQLMRSGDDEPPGNLYGDPLPFFQDWARRRARWLTQWREAKNKKWHVTPRELDECPGSLVVGDIDKVRWNAIDMPDAFACIGLDPKAVNRAILRSANLPRAHGPSVARAA